MINMDTYQILLAENKRLRNEIGLYCRSIERKARILAEDSIIKKDYSTQQRAEEISSLAQILLQPIKKYD